MKQNHCLKSTDNHSVKNTGEKREDIELAGRRKPQVFNQDSDKK